MIWDDIIEYSLLSLLIYANKIDQSQTFTQALYLLKWRDSTLITPTKLNSKLN